MSGPSLVNTIQSEIERARQDLRGVDENLRRLTGRDFNDPNQRPDLRRVRLTSGSRDDEPPAKRRPPGGVFARLGAVVVDQQPQEPRGRPRGDLRNELRVDHRGGDRGDLHGDEPPRGGRRVQEVLDTDEKLPKPSLPSSVARPLLDSKSRSEAAAELTKDRASRDRNRRMFGALLGTLKRFKNDEAKQKDKEEQRAAIERKLEEKGRAEKEELRRERLELFNQRKERQAQIRRLTIKMARVKEHEVWEAHQMKLAKFIRTESIPPIFWVPRQHNARTTGLVHSTHDKITGELEHERLRMKEELDEILGSRGEEREGAEIGEEEEEETFVHRGLRSQVAKQGEGGGTDHLDNCPDLLDYEAEEGELVYDEADLSGKDDNDDTERVVVQVDGRGEGGRKVEIVASQPGEENGEEGKSGGGLGNDSEKENEGRRKDRDRNREEKHREKDSRKNRDKGREKERSKDKDGEVQRVKDRLGGREERATSKDSHKESEREKRKERARSKDSSEVQDLDSELSTTVVHIKIEKEDDAGTSETRPVLKIIKEEKPDEPHAGGRKGENTEKVPVVSDGASPAVPATASDAISTADIELPPLPASDPTLSPANNSNLPSNLPDSAPPHPRDRSLSPLPMNPSPPPISFKAQLEAEKEPTPSGEGKASKKDEGLANSGASIGGKGSPEHRADKQQNMASGTTASDKQASGKKDTSSKVPARGKLQKDEKRKVKKDKLKKKTKKKKTASGSKKNSGSSDDSSSGSSDSSSDSSESDSSDSDSSSSSSSDSGSSSDSESDSSFSSSSHSDSDSGREKRKRKRGRRSRSEDSSSDSDAEGKPKRKSKIPEKSKQLREGGKASKGKPRDESLSDDDRAKKEAGKKDKFKEGKKGKEREETHKSKEKEKTRERDLEHRKEREAVKKGGSIEKRDRNREQRRERSRSREDRRGGKKDRR